MKKFIISLALIAAFSSCEKEKQIAKESSTINPTYNNTKAKGVDIKVEFTAGHPSSQCNGQGACFNYTPGYWPNYAHIPCQGSGTDCKYTITIGTDLTQSDAVFEISGYERDTFLMPSRSLHISEKNAYLNIPQQVLLKVEGGYQFNNLSVTDQPVFENL